MGKLDEIIQMTQTKFLNLFTFKGKNGKNVPFTYYVASRAKNINELKVNKGLDKTDAVSIYALYGENKDKVVLVRQYRVPINDYIYEFPAGLCEENEDCESAAKREMFEETGLDFTPIKVDEIYQKSRYMSVGMSDESITSIYGYAKGTPTSIHEEASEEIEVVIADKEEVRRILKEEIVTVMCAYQLMHFLNDEKPFDFLK